jgi:hypothetical protein
MCNGQQCGLSPSFWVVETEGACVVEVAAVGSMQTGSVERAGAVGTRFRGVLTSPAVYFVVLELRPVVQVSTMSMDASMVTRQHGVVVRGAKRDSEDQTLSVEGGFLHGCSVESTTRFKEHVCSSSRHSVF